MNISAALSAAACRRCSATLCGLNSSLMLGCAGGPGTPPPRSREALANRWCGVVVVVRRHPRRIAAPRARPPPSPPRSRASARSGLLRLSSSAACSWGSPGSARGGTAPSPVRTPPPALILGPPLVARHRVIHIALLHLAIARARADHCPSTHCALVSRAGRARSTRRPHPRRRRTAHRCRRRPPPADCSTMRRTAASSSSSPSRAPCARANCS